MKDQAEKLRGMALNAKYKIEKELLKDLKHTKVIVISSGKGGTGKSTLAVNLSVDLCRKGKKVLLFDADLGLANIDIMLGLVPKFNLYHVVNGMKTIQDIIISVDYGLHIIPGGSGIYELANISQEKLKNLLVQLGKLDGVYDYMIIDTGAGLSESVLTFLLAGDDAIIVTTTEPTSITDAYGIVKSLSKHRYEGTVNLVVNRVSDSSEGIMVGEKFKLVCKKFLDIDLFLLGYIVNDPLISEGIKKQQSFIKLYPRSIAAQNVSMITEVLLKNIQPLIQTKSSGGGIRNFFKKLAAGINKQ